MTPHPKEQSRKGRRGSNVVEFALIAPILIVMMGGIVDYGWYFWREALLINGLREAVRAGSLQLPPSGQIGATCTTCVSAASSAVKSELLKQGYSVTVAAKIERIPASGTPCSYAVVVDTKIPHERIVSLVPGPHEFKLRVMSMAQNMTCP